MDFFINGRFAGRRLTGVERYAGETVRVLGSRARLLAPAFLSSGLPGHLWEQMVLPALVPEHGLLWSPANTGPLRVERQVVTIHDLAPLDHPEWFSGPFASWYRWLLPRLARRVRAVIAVSEFTRRRLLSIGVSEDRVFVVGPGVSRMFGTAPADARRRVRERYALPERYVLSVGTLEPRKNLPRLLRAWRRISPGFPGLGIVIAGARGRPFRRPGLGPIPENVMLLGPVPDDDLIPLYAGATAFALVSLYEGFGLTALEAMASGVPCVVSDVEGLAEAVGDSALLVDPRDEGAIEAGLLRVLNDDGLRASLRAKGLERARSLRWEDTAERVWNVCQSVGG